MKEPKTNAEVANWCIVNALKLPNELVVSIATKLMQNIPEQERTEVMQRAGWINSNSCVECGETKSATQFSRCTNCLEKATGHSGFGNF